MRLYLGLLFLLAPGCLFGWEPYKSDITQHTTVEISDGLDHLEPVDRKIPESPYLLEYIHEPSTGNQYVHLTLSRDASGRFFIRTWSEWKSDTQPPPPTEVLGPSAKIELPVDMASSVYSMWVNELLEIRYDRLSDASDSSLMDIFSVFIQGRGYLHGIALSPTKDLPPKWMEDSATALIQFTKDKDEAACRRTLTDLRDKLFAYLSANGKH